MIFWQAVIFFPKVATTIYRRYRPPLQLERKQNVCVCVGGGGFKLVRCAKRRMFDKYHFCVFFCFFFGRFGPLPSSRSRDNVFDNRVTLRRTRLCEETPSNLLEQRNEPPKILNPRVG